MWSHSAACYAIWNGKELDLYINNQCLKLSVTSSNYAECDIFRCLLLPQPVDLLTLSKKALQDFKWELSTS